MRIFISQKPTIRRICRLDHFAAISILAGTRKRNVLASCLIVLAFALTAQQGHACTLNVTGVNFGSYDVATTFLQPLTVPLYGAIPPEALLQ